MHPGLRAAQGRERPAAPETPAGAEGEAQKEALPALPLVAPSSSVLVSKEPTKRQTGMTSLFSQSRLSPLPAGRRTTEAITQAGRHPVRRRRSTSSHSPLSWPVGATPAVFNRQVSPSLGVAGPGQGQSDALTGEFGREIQSQVQRSSLLVTSPEARNPRDVGLMWPHTSEW